MKKYTHQLFLTLAIIIGCTTAAHATQPIHFVDFSPFIQWSTYIGTITINDLEIVNDKDEVGVFFIDSQGNERLCGATVMGDVIKDFFYVDIYGDDPESPVEEGPENGSSLIFKFWDQSDHKEYVFSQKDISFQSADHLKIPENNLPVWNENTYGLMNIHHVVDNTPVKKQPTHFVGYSPYIQWSTYIGKISLLEIENDKDEVGVFIIDSQGNEKICGACVMGNPIKDNFYVDIYGDDPVTLEKDGAHQDDLLIFKFWDDSAQIEYTFSNNDISFQAEAPLKIPDQNIPVWRQNTYGLMNIQQFTYISSMWKKNQVLTENAEAFDVTIQLNQTAKQDIDIFYTIETNDSTLLENRTPFQGVIQVQKGHSTAHTVIPIIDDKRVENQAHIIFTLNPSDHAVPGEIYQHVIVINDDDHCPVIKPDQTFSLFQNSPSQYTLGRLIAADKDSNSLTYQILKGNELDIFAIHPTSGIIWVKNNDALPGAPQKIVLVMQVSDSVNHAIEPVTIHIITPRFEITSVSGSHGKIIPQGTFQVSENDCMSFAFSPDAGYQINEIFIDGVLIESGLNAYRFCSISDNHILSVTFSPINQQYTLTTSIHQPDAGKIEPSGTTRLYEGSSQTILIQPGQGYELMYIKVNEQIIYPKALILDNSLFLTKNYRYRLDNISQSYVVTAFIASVEKPAASFMITNESGTAPLNVNFSDTSQGNITHWFWEFGDGFTSQMKNPKHTYFDSGQYTVVHTITGPGGSDTITHINCITVTPTAIQTNFFARPTSGNAPLTVSFQAIDIQNIASIVWDFGDNSEENYSINPLHTYDMPGVYTVTVSQVINGKKSIIEKKNYITVTGRKISGIVTDDSNNALENAYVIVWNKNGRIIAEQSTDTNGQYTIADLPKDSGLVAGVWPPLDKKNAYLPQFYHQQETRSQADRFSTEWGDVQIDFQLQAVSNLTIKGTVFKGTEGLPDVRVDAFSMNLNGGQDTVTDADGNYTLTGLLESDDYIIFACMDNCTVEYFYTIPADKTPGVFVPVDSTNHYGSATPVTPSDPAIEHIDLFVFQNTISGQVTADHKPVAGLWVNAWSEVLKTGGGAFTDLNGNYTISGLKPVLSKDVLTNGYYIEISQKGYAYQIYPSPKNPERVATGRLDINFQLPTTRTISGYVQDENGFFLPNIFVSAVSKETGKRSNTISDSKGGYTLVVPVAPDYIIMAGSIEYPVLYYDQQSDKDAADRIDVTANNVTDVNFQFQSGGIIRGQVFIETVDTPAHEGLWVNVWSESSQSGGTVPTDKNGRFEIKGLSYDVNDYMIAIIEKGYLPVFYDNTHQWDQAVPVSPSLIDRNLILTKGYAIHGCVLLNHQPYSGIGIEAWSEESIGWGQTQSERTGCPNFHIQGLPPGQYNVSLHHDLFVNTDQEITITNDDVILPPFVLKKNSKSISGTITGLSSGEKAQLNVWSQRTGFQKTKTIIGTGSIVSYRLTGLKVSDDYIVQLYSPNHPKWFYDHQTQWHEADGVDISEHDATDIDFVLKSTRQISGILCVNSPPGKNDLIWVNAFSKSTGIFNSAMVRPVINQAVPYTIKGLEDASDYIVFTLSDTYMTQYYQNVDRIENALKVNLSDSQAASDINFSLTTGNDISGSIFLDGIPANNVMVEAWSESLQSGGKAKTSSKGAYQIEGLSQANDYIVKSIYSNNCSFYYSLNGSVRLQTGASPVSTSYGNAANIDINMTQGNTISGTIRDQNGKGLSSIWVEISSDSLATGDGVFSRDDGSYEINGLPDGNDFKISVSPHHTLCYSPQFKDHVSSNSIGVDFILSQGFQLQGIITSSADGTPLSKIEIEIYSNNTGFYVKTISSRSGTYEMCGLPCSDDYVVNIQPTKESGYISFIEKGLYIKQDTVKNISLSTGFSISGHVYLSYTDEFTNEPYTETLWVNAVSAEHLIFANAVTDENGYYNITNLPDYSDYVISISPPGFGQQRLENQSAGDVVDFILEKAGSISGSVKDVTGKGLENVRVTAFSSFLDFGKSARTDANGHFTIDGLKRSINNNPVTDYVITAFTLASGYPNQSVGQKRVGDTVHFSLMKSEENEIIGTIIDNTNTPPKEQFSILVMAFETNTTGRPEKQTRSNADGSFSLSGLDSTKEYQLLFYALNGAINGTPKQWSGVNNTGIVLSERHLAKTYASGEHVVFQFDGNWAE